MPDKLQDAFPRTSPLKGAHLRGGVWATAGTAALALVTFLNFLILSRLLAPEIFGLLAMVSAVLAFGQAMLPTHAAEALVQMRRLKAAHGDSLFVTLQALGIAAACLMVAGGQAAERFFSTLGLAHLVTAAAFTVYLQALAAVPRALLVRRMRFAAIAKAELGAEAAGGAVGIAMAAAGYGVWSLIAMQVVARAVESAVLWRVSRWRPRLRWSAPHIRELLGFGVSRTLIVWVRFLDAQLPRLLLGHYFGAAELGGFFFARRLVEACEKLLVSPIQAVGMPAFARLQDDADAVRKAYRSGSRLTAAVLFPAFAGLALLAPVLTPLLFGESWVAAIPLIQLFALRGYRRALSTWNSAALRGLGRPEWLLLTVGFQVLLSLGFMLLLLGQGATGVAWALLISSYLSWPVGAWFVGRTIAIGSLAQAKLGLPSLGATAIMALAVLGARLWSPLQTPSWSAAIGLALIAAASYGIGLILFGREDVRLLAGFARRLLLVWR